MKILIIEDEVSLSDAVVEYLDGEGHLCEVAYNYEEGFEKIELYP